MNIEIKNCMVNHICKIGKYLFRNELYKNSTAMECSPQHALQYTLHIHYCTASF